MDIAVFLIGRSCGMEYLVQQRIPEGEFRLILLIVLSNSWLGTGYRDQFGLYIKILKASLLAWKKYRVRLNRLDITQAPDIDWPDPPSETNG
ncbi:MAG: tail fiber assembly protein [Sodalis sp. (in: enterobacteria)]|uniref:tail fiber assembly protein n=1 Tax=Sodalis sp. (in: enterobacteria) TaxID=1898979 RepID=UPI0039E33687